MNSKIAISLLIGVITSVLAAFLSADIKYVYIYDAEDVITKEEYEYKSSKNYDTDSYKLILKYNYAFMLLGFIGGFASGYLISDKIEKAKENKH